MHDQARAKYLQACHRAGARFAKTDAAWDMDGDALRAEAGRRYRNDSDACVLFLYGVYDAQRAMSAPVMDI